MDKPGSDELRELKALNVELKTDVGKCVQQYNQQKDQTAARNVARAVFAWTDGAMYRLRQCYVFAFNNFNVKYEVGEVVFLLEENYSLSSNGDVQSNERFPQGTTAVRFTFKMSACAFRTSFELNVSDHGWQSYQKALKVRHRITHPKRVGLLNVSTDDVADLIAGAHWFDTEVMRLMGEASDAARAVDQDNSNGG